METTIIDLQQIEARTRALTSQLRLALRNSSWQGNNGNWLGDGTGNSLEFQDHRPYYPGDNPRYINWSAFARTDLYSMKLYRQEVSPQIDLVFDCSASMAFETSKATRSLELLYFTAQSALQSGCSLRIVLATDTTPIDLPTDALFSKQRALLLTSLSGEKPLNLQSLRLRYGSLRIVISDLLFPGLPQPILTQLTSSKGRAMILCPYSLSECAPQWDGNTTFVDCENNRERRQLVDRQILENYHFSYTRHFDIWSATCNSTAIGFARIAAEEALGSALAAEAINRGLVETCT